VRIIVFGTHRVNNYTAASHTLKPHMRINDLYGNIFIQG
jgi:hypothetical protein